MKSKKGFTLMEMLIVVAIIAILIAIGIPTFSAQLERTRESADAATIRSAIAEVTSAMMLSETNHKYAVKVTIKQTVAGWDYIDEISGVKTLSSSDLTYVPGATKNPKMPSYNQAYVDNGNPTFSDVKEDVIGHVIRGTACWVTCDRNGRIIVYGANAHPQNWIGSASITKDGSENGWFTPDEVNCSKVK